MWNLSDDRCAIVSILMGVFVLFFSIGFDLSLFQLLSGLRKEQVASLLVEFLESWRDGIGVMNVS